MGESENEWTHLSICPSIILSVLLSFCLSVWLKGDMGGVLVTVWQCAPLHMRDILMPGTPLLVSTQAFHSDAMPILINLLDTYSN